MNAGIVNPNLYPSNSDTQVANRKEDLDQNAFLRLLVTQLRYQNPTEPMSNEEFVAQSAQFSSLEQMTALNASVQELVALQKSAGNAEALNLIGKSVVVQKSTLSLEDNLPANISYSLSEDASVVVTIHDGGEEPVKIIDLGAQLAGKHALTWDGLNNDGVRMPSGQYVYNISAIDANGNAVNASGIISGIVDGVVFGDEPYISIDGAHIPLANIAEVSMNKPES